MVQRVAVLPPRSAIYYATVRVDARGAPQEDNQSLTRLHAVANAPIFSYVDSNLGRGIVGGPLISVEEVAHRGAAVALRIFGGEPAGSIKTPTLGLAAPVYDWRELQRWSIRESALPPDSTVRFRPPTILEAYRWELTALVAAILIPGRHDRLAAARASAPPACGSPRAQYPVRAHAHEPGRDRG